MSELMVAVLVSDRNAKEGVSGLHAQVSLRERLSDKVYEFEGNATLSDEVTIERIDITRNEVNAPSELVTKVLEAAFEGCWNDVVIGNRAAAGFRWRPFIPWLAGHIDVDLLPILRCQITTAFQKICHHPPRCTNRSQNWCGS